MKDTNFRKHGDKLLFVLALAVLITALFRQGWGKTISQAVAPTMVFTQWWQDDHEKETLKKLIQEFENLHSEIKIVLKTVPYEDLRSGLFNPSETPPGDILAMDPLWVPELQKRGIIESSARQTGNAPVLSFINVLYYNVGILKEAGFNRPPKNRSEFLDYARTITKGIAMDVNSSRGIYDDVYPWFWTAGAQLIKDGKPAVNSRQVIDGLSFLASLNSEGLIVPDISSGGADEKLEDFISGKAAFMIAPVSDIKLVTRGMGTDAFGICSVPVPDNYTGKSFYGTAGWTVGVYSGSAHREEANLFVDFLAGNVSLLSDATNAIPAIDAPPATNILCSKAWDIAIAGESAKDFSDISGEHELEGIFRQELSALFDGKSTPAGAAAAIQKRWSESLDKL